MREKDCPDAAIYTWRSNKIHGSVCHQPERSLARLQHVTVEIERTGVTALDHRSILRIAFRRCLSFTQEQDKTWQHKKGMEYPLRAFCPSYDPVMLLVGVLLAVLTPPDSKAIGSEFGWYGVVSPRQSLWYSVYTRLRRVPHGVARVCLHGDGYMQIAAFVVYANDGRFVTMPVVNQHFWLKKATFCATRRHWLSRSS